MKFPDGGRLVTKAGLRNELADLWADDDRLTAEAEMAWFMLSQPSTIKALHGVIEKLSKTKL